MRFVAPSIVVLVCLVAPGRAAAHARTPTVAFRLALSQPVARPALWPWLAAGAGVVIALAGVARAVPNRRGETAAAVAGLGAIEALDASAAFANADATAGRTQWIEVGSAAVLAVVAAVALLVGDRSVRTDAAMVVGVVAAALGLGSLGVFRHAVVISSLPATIARLATAVAVAAGIAAVVLVVLTPTDRRVPR